MTEDEEEKLKKEFDKAAQPDRKSNASSLGNTEDYGEHEE